MYFKVASINVLAHASLCMYFSGIIKTKSKGSSCAKAPGWNKAQSDEKREESHCAWSTGTRLESWGHMFTGARNWARRPWIRFWILFKDQDYLLYISKDRSGCCTKKRFPGKEWKQKTKKGWMSEGAPEAWLKWRNKFLAGCTKWEVNGTGSALLPTEDSVEGNEGHLDPQGDTASALKELTL